MPQAPRTPRGSTKPDRQAKASQQHRTTPKLAKLMDPRPDIDGARRNVVDAYGAGLRTRTPEQLLAAERDHRARGDLDLAAVTQAEIERRAKGPKP